MADHGGSRPPRLRAGPLIAALWAIGLIRLFAPDDLFGPVPALILALYVALGLAGAGWHLRLLALGLGGATLALCLAFDVWAAAWRGLDRAALFGAFLASIVMIRATAGHRPDVAAARRLFAALDPARRGGGVLVGAHILGSVLVVGAMAVIAPIVGEHAEKEERRRLGLTALRGLNLVVCWTPFAVAIAVAHHYVPSVPLWQTMPLGIAMGTVGLLFSFFVFDRSGGLGDLVRALASFRPVLAPVAVAALTMAAMNAFTDFSTLESLILAVPALCLAGLASQGGAAVRGALDDTWRNLDRLGPELCLLAFSLVLGLAFEAALGKTGIAAWLAGLALPPFAVIATIVGLMVAVSLIGIHPMVSMTVLLVLFAGAPTGVADLVLVQSVLVGWAIGTSASVAGIAVATGAAMFRVDPVRLVFPENALFAVCCGIVLVAILGALNLLVAG